MEDKRLKNAFSHTLVRGLQFTKEDRQKVFEQLRELDENPQKMKKSFVTPKKFIPITVSLLVVGLCLFLFLPTILPGKLSESTSSNVNQEPNTSVASGPVVEEGKVVTTLITVKSKEMDNRIYLNLLLTYSKDKKMMKVVSPNHFTYAPVGVTGDGIKLYDRLLFAYHFGGAENVRATVSKLFDLPIDNYAVMDLETISLLIDSMNGIDYDLQEDVRVRAITQVAFDFEKGMHRLNGEEVVALMMATSEFDGLGEEHLVNLMNTVMNKVNEIPPEKLKELLTPMESNVSLDALLENQVNTIQYISLKDGMITDSRPLSSTTGEFYYQLDEDFLKTISQQLTNFD